MDDEALVADASAAVTDEVDDVDKELKVDATAGKVADDEEEVVATPVDPDDYEGVAADGYESPPRTDDEEMNEEEQKKL